uniref:NADH-ubiquinone oxidoreductase chain 3 n=1 Tax=Carpelimus fuliginosus TaxID=1587133 RepID=A0A343C166_9COLE|nr:NADH dehydrogenase subunit 3 [Carpelimus fuliginosus]
MMILSLITLTISIIVMFLSNLISKKTMMDQEKNSPFECGFDPKNSARLPFSLHFFLIAIIFLIFDVEITLLIPFIMMFKITCLYNYFTLMMMFIMILLLGIYHEWNQGALNWIN